MAAPVGAETVFAEVVWFCTCFFHSHLGVKRAHDGWGLDIFWNLKNTSKEARQQNRQRLRTEHEEVPPAGIAPAAVVSVKEVVRPEDVKDLRLKPEWQRVPRGPLTVRCLGAALGSWRRQPPKPIPSDAGGALSGEDGDPQRGRCFGPARSGVGVRAEVLFFGCFG